MNKWQWVSALVTMALFTACQQDMTEDVLTPEASKQMNVIVTAQQGEGVDSRVSYTPQEGVDGTSVVVRWEGKPEEMLTYTYYDNTCLNATLNPINISVAKKITTGFNDYYAVVDNFTPTITLD